MYYAFTNEYENFKGMYKNYHVFDSKKERDNFVKENENAFKITKKEFEHDINHLNNYSDILKSFSEIIEH